jgi:DNA-binding transcriptional regulator LsrR (DeoR family)
MARPANPPASTAEMLKAARLYYKEGKSKKEIAGLLYRNTDTRPVRKLLAEARRAGIVRIQIYETEQSSLEDAIKTKFPHLHRVLIAPGRPVKSPDQYDDLLQNWARLAADYFEELWEQHPRDTPLHVGVGGGEHLARFADEVAQRRRENVFIHVTALIPRGRLDPSTSHIDPVVTASILWSHCGSLPGHCEYATVSPYVSEGPGPAARQAVREELAKVEVNATVREVIEAMDNLDVVFAGLDTVNPGKINPAIKHRITMQALLQNIVTWEQLESEGALGDFAYCPFDARGNGRKDWRFFLTAGHNSQYPGVEFYKHMADTPGKKVIAFGGPYQLPVIKTALKAKICNVLITDEATAREVAEAS